MLSMRRILTLNMRLISIQPQITRSALAQEQMVGRRYVPLQHYARAVGSPSLQNVQTARIWFSGFSSPVTFRFAQIDLVGSRWIRLPQDTTGTVDSNFSVSFVNYED